MAKKLIKGGARTRIGANSKKAVLKNEKVAPIVMCTEYGSDNVIPFTEGSNDFSCNNCGEEFSIN